MCCTSGPHFRCVRGNLQSVRHFLGGSNVGGFVLHVGPWAFVHVHTGQNLFRSLRDLPGLWKCPGDEALSVVLSNILVDGFARAVHDAGVSLMASWDSRFAGQLYADDLVIVADSTADFQAGLDAV